MTSISPKRASRSKPARSPTSFDSYSRISSRRERNFDLAQCRRYGIHAQTARQVEQTYEQILQIAQGQGLLRKESASDPSSSQGSREPMSGLPTTPCAAAS